MKILVASKGYFPRMKAHQMLMNTAFNWHYIFDNDEQRTKTIRKLGFPRARCHIADTPNIGQCGVAFVREWGERNLTSEGEWYCWMDDNVSHFTRLPNPWYQQERIDFDVDLDLDMKLAKQYNYDWRAMYETPCSILDVLEVINETINKCIEIDTVFAGFAIETNYFFRRIKWQYLGYVRTQFAIVKNTGLPWYYWPGNMLEDFTRSVDVIIKYGSIIINRFMKPHKTFYETGGIGSFKQRLPNLVATNQELMRRYPGLLRYNKGQDYQLTFAIRGMNSINRWRQEHAS